jgi:hypothetical protein
MFPFVTKAQDPWRGTVTRSAMLLPAADGMVARLDVDFKRGRI